MTREEQWEALTPRQFVELIKDGKSYNQIGAMFGVSRNTVSGKAYRWKAKKLLPDHLPGHPVRRSGPKPATEERRARKPQAKKSQTGVILARNPEPRDPPPQRSLQELFKEPVIEVPGEPVPLKEKKDWMCAVVVGYDDKHLPLYCGCTATRNFRMCEFHAQTMLQPLVVRARDRYGRPIIARKAEVA